MIHDAEYILCSAIRRKFPRKVSMNPYAKNDILNIEIGFRHCDILIRFPDEIETEARYQGFYTSFGRFVDRKEAAMIAFRAGQINERKQTLFSEDLY